MNVEPIRLTVLNPGGRDALQSFAEGPGHPNDGAHPPVNYHAYAACTRGMFCRDVGEIQGGAPCVLVLIGSALRRTLSALESLRSMGATIAVGWKETGVAQVARRLDDARNITLFRKICELSDGAVSSTPELVALYRAAGCRHVEYIPTPYPVDDPRWDFARPLRERSGIFIGTREFGVHARAHVSALMQACAVGAPVTVCNIEGWRGRRRLSALGSSRLRVIEGRMPYREYLRTMAACRVVFQQDASQVPGQVAGDALLCRMPCIGGNGAVDREVFVAENLESLLTDDAAWTRCVAESQTRASERLAYGPVAARLHDFFKRARER